MSSLYGINSPPRSSRMRGLSAQNMRTMKNLGKELSRLDIEKKNRMRELNQATKHFLDIKIRASSARSRDSSPDRCSFTSLPAYSSRDRSSSRSPSPSPRSPLDDLFPLTSPRNHKIIYRKSSSTEESSTSPNHLSPRSSPESQRKLLSKRTVDDNNKIDKSHNKSHTSTNSTITHVAYISLPHDRAGHVTTSVNPTSPRNKTRKPTQASVGIPKIVVSDTTPKLPEIVPSASKRCSSPVKRNSIDSPARKDSSKPSNDDVLNGSLHVPTRRCRSNSVPTISPSIQELITKAKDDSKSTVDNESPRDIPIPHRPRSSSVCVPYFDHLKDAPRRDSLLRKYIARPKIFHRTAKTIDQLISDLAKGIYHEELLDGNRSKPITPEEWESLKLCRYLRMPSKEEDVKGNTLDIEAIFSD